MAAETSQSILSQLETALAHIVKEDFPDQWPELLGSVFAAISSGDGKAVKAGVMVALILSQ